MTHIAKTDAVATVPDFTGATDETARRYEIVAEAAKARALSRPDCPHLIVEHAYNELAFMMPKAPPARCERLWHIIETMDAFSGLSVEHWAALDAPRRWSLAAAPRIAATGRTEQVPAIVMDAYRAAFHSHPALKAVLDRDERKVGDAAERAAFVTRNAQEQFDAEQAVHAEGRKLAPKLLADLARRGVTLSRNASGAAVFAPASLMTSDEIAQARKYAAAIRELAANELVV